jgi:hypothetical protein
MPLRGSAPQIPKSAFNRIRAFSNRYARISLARQRPFALTRWSSTRILAGVQLAGSYNQAQLKTGPTVSSELRGRWLHPIFAGASSSSGIAQLASHLQICLPFTT